MNNMSTILIRIFIDLMLLFIMFTQWWWMAIILGAICVLLLPKFYEYILIGICLDLFFGTLGSMLWGGVGIITVSTIVFYVIVQAVKSQIRY